MSKYIEIYISTDVETDGPIPGANSMLSLGSAAFVDYNLVSTFSVNIKQLFNASMDKKTKEEFWDKNPDAWEACRENMQAPDRAMKNYVNWLNSLQNKYNGSVVFVGYPATFDFMFVYWYLIKFVGKSPFSFSAIDMKTMAMVLTKKPFKKCYKKNMPKHWFDDNKKHTHIALDDAIEQGFTFCQMMKDLYKK